MTRVSLKQTFSFSIDCHDILTQPSRILVLANKLSTAEIARDADVGVHSLSQ